jgi:hypothetical protein
LTKKLLDSVEYPSIIRRNSDFDQYNFTTLIQHLKQLVMFLIYSLSELVNNFEKVYVLVFSILYGSLVMTFKNSSEWLHLHEIINKHIHVPHKHSSEILQNMRFNSIFISNNLLTHKHRHVEFYLFLFLM